MINELKVRCFLGVAKTLSFTKASYNLYISQQAVSKHVADLEKDIGVRLFERDRKRVYLTDEGKLYLAFFDDVATRFASLQEQVKSVLPDSASCIHIGYQIWLNFGSAPVRAINTLHQNFPEIHLVGERHSPFRLLRLLNEGKLDVLLMNKRFIPKGTGFQVLPLFESPMLIIASVENSLNGEGASYKSFKNEPLLIDVMEGEAEEDAMRRATHEVKKLGFKPSRIIVLPNRDSVYTEAGINRGVFFASSLAQIPNSEQLIRYQSDIIEMVCCVWNAEQNDKLMSLFAKTLKAEYEGESIPCTKS